MLVNLPRTTAFLAECRLDALIASSWPNVLYLSDVYVWLQPVFKEYMAKPGGSDNAMSIFALITNQGNAGLVIDQTFEMVAASSWVPNRFVYGFPASFNDSSAAGSSVAGGFQRSPHRFRSPMEALAAALHAEQLSDARIGLEMGAMPEHSFDALKSAMPRAEFLDATNLFRMIRMVKSEEELHRLRHAAEINEQAAAESLNAARPGDNIQRVSQHFQASVAMAGATFDHFAFSQRGIGIATEADYELPAQESLFVDYGCIFRHYYSDAGTTLNVGNYGNQERTGYGVLVDCLHETAARMLPGASASSIQEFMQHYLDSNGIKGQYPHGHGIGIELRDYPILAPHEGRRIRDDCIDVSADLPLEAGMVINLETPVLEWNGSALQLEQTYLVADRGAKAITARNLSNPVVVGN